MRGYQDCVVLLLDSGTDVDARCTDGSTAVYLASEGCYYSIAILLIERRADVNILGGLQGPASHVASAKGYKDIVRLLLDKGANVETKNPSNKTAFALADEGGHRAIRKLLRDYVLKVERERNRKGLVTSSWLLDFTMTFKLLALQKPASIESILELLLHQNPPNPLWTYRWLTINL